MQFEWQKTIEQFWIRTCGLISARCPWLRISPQRDPGKLMQENMSKICQHMVFKHIQAMFRKSMNFWSTGDTMLNFKSMLKCKTVNFWWLVPNLEHQPSQAGRPGLLAQNWAQWHLISGPTPDIWHRFHIRWWNQLIITLQTHATSIKQKNGRHACGQVGCM